MAPAPPPGSVVISDTFTGALNHLQNHIPNVDVVGDGWKRVEGNWVISRGRVEDLLGYSEPYFTTINPSATNYTAAIDVTWFGASEAGLVFRYEDDNNYYSAVYTGRHFELRKTTDGRTAALKRSAVDWDRFETKTIEATVDDRNIEVRIGTTVLETSDSRHQFSRGVGAIVQRTGNDQFKELNVHALGPAVSPPPITAPLVGDSIVYDSFTDVVDPIGLSFHIPEKAPPGSSWSSPGGSDPTVTGGVAKSGTIGIIEAGTANVDIYTDVEWSAGTAGIYYRYVDQDNYWKTWVDGGYLVTASTDSANGFKVHGIMRFDWDGVQTRSMRIRINDHGIRVYVDHSDLPRMKVVSDVLEGATKVGFDGGNQYEHFVVAQSPALPTPDVIPTDPPPEPPVPAVPPGAPPGLVLYDSFSDVPNSWHPAHIPDLAPEFRRWSTNSGVWLSDFDQLTEVTGEKSDQRIVINSGVEDSLISTKIVWRSGRAGVTFRYRDEANWAMAWHDGVGDVVFGKVVLGEFEEMGRHAVQVEEGKTYRLNVWIENDTASVEFAGDFLGSFDVSELPLSTHVGLFSRNTQPARFDNLSVSAHAIQPKPGGFTYTPVVFDTFTEAGIVSLDSVTHTPEISPVGSAWFEATGIWEMESNSAREILGWNADQRAVIKGTSGDQRVSADITYNGGIAGLTLRYEHEGSWYMFWYDGVNILIGRNVNNSFSLLDLMQLDWGPLGTERNMAVTFVGDTITGYIDGTDVMQVTNQTDLDVSFIDKAGMFARNNPLDTRFDNFTVEAITP